MNKTAQDLQDIFLHAVNLVAGETVVSRELSMGGYPDKFHLVAIGKAADSMLQGVPSESILSGLLISKHGHISVNCHENSKLICLESDHPVPKESSIKAGEALLDYLQNLPEKEPCIFLISGGTSALVEVLQEGWDLEQLQALTNYLLANTYPIDEINAIRRQLSKIKGGGLWQFMEQRPVYCLMISDVADDDPAVIGSGLLFPVEETLLPELPKEWLDKININQKHVQAEDFEWKVIASLAEAKKVAANKAKALGYQVEVVPKFVDGEAEKNALLCVQKIKAQANTLFIWGGETTVNLPKNAGMGGRNQHLALAAAIQMNGMESAYLLAAGTDGTDGLTSATGAVVDGLTVQRGAQRELATSDYLERADSNSFFKKTKGLINTGATGTNVMDLVIAINLRKS